VSVILLILAALSVEQVVAASRHQTGVDLDRLAIVQINLGAAPPNNTRAERDVDLALQAARQQLGVESAAVATGLPAGLTTRHAGLTAPDEPLRDRYNGRPAVLLAGTPGLFHTLGVPIVRGRAFGDQDLQSTMPVVVLSDIAAQSVFGTSNVVGRQVLIKPQPIAGQAEPVVETRTVVGVCADTDAGLIGRRDRGVAYLPWAQHPDFNIAVIARSVDAPDALVEPLKAAVRKIDPDIVVTDAGTGLVLSGADNQAMRVMAALAGSLGGLALVLALVGLYGVLAHLVSRRMREMGVRIALGADAGGITRMILADGLKPVVSGVVLGLVLGVIARMSLQPLFVGLFPKLEPLALVVVPVALILVAIAACYIPARRAARVNPNVALRDL
jgi:putative ABC transport system permease protein